LIEAQIPVALSVTRTGDTTGGLIPSRRQFPARAVDAARPIRLLVQRVETGCSACLF
jgi:hypothetical protein